MIWYNESSKWDRLHNTALAPCTYTALTDQSPEFVRAIEEEKGYKEECRQLGVQKALWPCKTKWSSDPLKSNLLCNYFIGLTQKHLILGKAFMGNCSSL